MYFISLCLIIAILISYFTSTSKAKSDALDLLQAQASAAKCGNKKYNLEIPKKVVI